MMHKAWSIFFQGHPSNFKAGDKIYATLLLLEILYRQIRKEVNIPIMISIFTQFMLYDVMWELVMCAAR